MTEPTRRSIPVAVRPRSRLHALLAKFAPRWFAAPTPARTSDVRLTDAGIPGPLQRAPTAPNDRVHAYRARRLLWLAVRSVAFAGTAVAVAWAFRNSYDGPMLPRVVFGVGTFGWLAAAAIAHFARPAHRPAGTDAGERRGPRWDYFLSWIGLLWASLSLL